LSSLRRRVAAREILVLLCGHCALVNCSCVALLPYIHAVVSRNGRKRGHSSICRCPSSYVPSTAEPSPATAFVLHMGEDGALASALNVHSHRTNARSACARAGHRAAMCECPGAQDAREGPTSPTRGEVSPEANLTPRAHPRAIRRNACGRGSFASRKPRAASLTPRTPNILRATSSTAPSPLFLSHSGPAP
jgi:hypothetical protein